MVGKESARAESLPTSRVHMSRRHQSVLFVCFSFALDLKSEFKKVIKMF
jgi:hypothetical protein